MLLEFGAVVLGSILRAAIGMMDAALGRCRLSMAALSAASASRASTRRLMA
jgi:hypothetical protein